MSQWFKWIFIVSQGLRADFHGESTVQVDPHGKLRFISEFWRAVKLFNVRTLNEKRIRLLHRSLANTQLLSIHETNNTRVTRVFKLALHHPYPRGWEGGWGPGERGNRPACGKGRSWGGGRGRAALFSHPHSHTTPTRSANKRKLLAFSVTSSRPHHAHAIAHTNTYNNTLSGGYY